MKNNNSKKSGINRRDFLVRASAGAATLPIILNGMPIKAFDGPRLQRLFNTAEETDRVLVLVQLNGGNDGLNTVVPLDQLSTYNDLRPGVAIPENKALALTDSAGFHPSFAELNELYKEQKVGVIQGVNYPNPNQSHFRSNDIWMSGSSADVSVSSGWLGRYLDTVYTDYPQGYPNEAMPDPVAIQMSAVVGLSLYGPGGRTMGMALQDPETFYNLVNGSDAPGTELPDAANARENVIYVRGVQTRSLEYSTVIKAAADNAQNLADYPTPNPLAEQLKIVARMIAGGLKTRAYVVTLGGFDTHAAQVDQDDPTSGAHANLLRLVSQALSAFQRDMEAHKIEDRVVCMSFSEFGRRPFSNLSYGTDHGTAAPMFFVGAPVQDGVTGTSPDMQDLDDQNLKIQHDFRQIYASVLEQWFGAEKSVISDVLFGDFETIKVIKGGATSVDETESNTIFSLNKVAPNPVVSQAKISYTIKESTRVRLDVFDAAGFHVSTLVDIAQTPDTYEVQFAAGNLPSGTYLVQLRAGGLSQAQHMVVTR